MSLPRDNWWFISAPNAFPSRLKLLLTKIVMSPLPFAFFPHWQLATLTQILTQHLLPLTFCGHVRISRLRFVETKVPYRMVCPTAALRVLHTHYQWTSWLHQSALLLCFPATLNGMPCHCFLPSTWSHECRPEQCAENINDLRSHPLVTHENDWHSRQVASNLGSPFALYVHQGVTVV